MDLYAEQVAKQLHLLQEQVSKYWSDAARQASIETRQARAQGRQKDHEQAAEDHRNAAHSHRQERQTAKDYGRQSGIPYEKAIEGHDRAAILHSTAADEYGKAAKAYGKGNAEKGDRHMELAENHHVSATVASGNAQRMSDKLHSKMKAAGIRAARKRLDELMTKAATLLAA
jgi:hypothetical protein